MSNDIKVEGYGGSEAFAGVGRANNASNVGNANNVDGVAGSNTFNLLSVPQSLPIIERKTAEHELTVCL